MKTKIYLLLAWTLLTAAGCSAENIASDDSATTPIEKPDGPVEPSADRKVLIVYLSHTGNTWTIAGYIHDTVKGFLINEDAVTSRRCISH